MSSVRGGLSRDPGPLGAGTRLRDAWGLPLGAALLAFALGALALRGLRGRDYRPTLVGLAGASAVLAGKFALDAPLSSTRARRS